MDRLTGVFCSLRIKLRRLESKIAPPQPAVMFQPMKEKLNNEARKPAPERSRNLRSKSLFTNNSPETTGLITDINTFN